MLNPSYRASLAIKWIITKIHDAAQIYAHSLGRQNSAIWVNDQILLTLLHLKVLLIS